MRRAYAGHDTTRAASTALNSDAPRAAATTIARMTVGNAITRSVMRMSVSSTQRPKNPATAPETAPIDQGQQHEQQGERDRDAAPR